MRHLRFLAHDLRANRDIAGFAVLAVVAFGFLVELLIATTATGATFGMARSHRRGTYVEWAMFQPLPAMYNYRNRGWTYLYPRTPGAPVDDVDRRFDGKRVYRYVNHHAFRLVADRRIAFLPRAGCHTTVLISDYRHHVLRTDYVTCRDEEGDFVVWRAGE